MNGTRQLVCADNVDLIGGNINITKKNTEVLLETSTNVRKLA